MRGLVSHPNDWVADEGEEIPPLSAVGEAVATLLWQQGQEQQELAERVGVEPAALQEYYALRERQRNELTDTVAHLTRELPVVHVINGIREVPTDHAPKRRSLFSRLRLWKSRG